jgi:hypothetical protein
VALVCAKCSRPIAPGEPVWRHSRGRWGRDRYHTYYGYPTVVWCVDCMGNHGERPRPCGGCGRLVYQRLGDPVRSRRVFCCERCLSHCRVKERAEVRRQARSDRRCAVCGVAFTPGRSDARTCSPACRQKAHRQRQKGG